MSKISVFKKVLNKMRELIIKKLKPLLRSSSEGEKEIGTLTDEELVDKWYNVVWERGYQHCIRTSVLSMKSDTYYK